MTPTTEALHACVKGILTAEAAVSLLSDCGSWLHRDDFTSQFITTADDADDGRHPDGPDRLAGRGHGSQPRPAALQQRGTARAQTAASIAAGTPVSLSDALTGIDRRNASLVVEAVAHASALFS